MMAVHLISLKASGKELAQAAVLSAVTDTSLSGSAIFSQSLELAQDFSLPKGAQLIAPTGEDAFSGVDMKTRKIRKGSCFHIQDWLQGLGQIMSEHTLKIVAEVESRGHQAVVLADHSCELGVIELWELSEPSMSS